MYRSQRTLSVSSFILTIALLFLHSTIACARGGGGGIELVYFDCQPNHSLYVKGTFLFDVLPTLDKRVISLGKMKAGQETQECQLSSSNKVVVKINANPSHSKNDNVSIIMNGKFIGNFTYEDPGHSYTYMFTSDSNDVSYVEIVETYISKTLSPEAEYR